MEGQDDNKGEEITMKEYSVEVGKKGKFQSRNVKFHYFDTLSEAKQFAREELTKGNAIDIQTADRYGDFQVVAILGQKNVSKSFPNWSKIGKLKPLKSQIKSSFGVPSDKDITRGVMG